MRLLGLPMQTEETPAMDEMAATFIGRIERREAVVAIIGLGYVGLPLAILWGWLIFGEWPGANVWVGCALIVGAGLFVFLRERKKDSPAPGRRRLWGRR